MFAIRSPSSRGVGAVGLLTRVAGCRVPGHMLSYRSARLETARVDADRLWLNSMSDPNALHSASAPSDLTENTFSSVERVTRCAYRV